jgi:hypothetical protein
MAKAVVARQLGDEYQQLVFWKYALRMLSGKYEIKNIRYEDNTVKSYDDVVIEYSKPQIFRDSTISKAYIQVKFHMRDDKLFTIDNLLDPSFINAKSNSLLDNVVEAYKKLGAEEFEQCVFVIYSMWDIAQNDVLYKLISNENSTIEIEKLFDGTTERSQMGEIRKKLCVALGVNEDTLKCILKQIRIKSRQEKMDDLVTSLNQQLENQGLQVISGSRHTNSYAQLIQNLYRSGKILFTKEFLEEQLHNEGLYFPKKEKALIAIRSFIKHAENLESEAEHILKLEDYFEGRFLKEEYRWEDTIYPMIKEFLSTNCQGDKEYSIQFEANPTIAFLAGRTLDIKTAKDIAPVQRTDNRIVKWDKKDSDIQYPQAISTSKILDVEKKDVAVVIGISREIFNDVEEFLLAEKEEIGRIIEIRLETTDSANVIDGMHAWRLANQIKNEIDKRVLKEKQGILHLFFSCPNSIVFLLGRYSLPFGKIQLYEYDFNKQRTCTYYLTMTLPVKEEF